MSEWWTYRPSDFLLFSSRTYYRLFELYNAELWPAQVLALLLGLLLLGLVWRGPPWAARAACLLLAAGWSCAAWAFHWQRYAAINWAAPGFAAAFALQAGLLAGVAFAGLRVAAPRQPGRAAGIGLLAFALAVQPVFGLLFGRPLAQAEVFGLAPDPTALGTLGVLLLLRSGAAAPGPWRGRLLRRLAWPLPLMWCALSGLTLWTMDAPDAWLLPAAAAVACVVEARHALLRRRDPTQGRR